MPGSITLAPKRPGSLILALAASLAMTLGAGGALLANDLAVTTDAAIAGVYGLEVIVDGSPKATFVADATPTDEQVYRASFRIAHNDLIMTEGTGHAIFMGRMAGGAGNVVRLYMRRQGDSYKIRCRWKKDTGGTGFCGQFTFAPINTRLTLEWVQASDVGTFDGIVRLYKGDALKAERTNLANAMFDIDTVRLGLPQGASATSGGSFYLDDFLSFRTLAP